MEEQQEGGKNSTRVLAISIGGQLFVYEGEAGEAVAKGVRDYLMKGLIDQCLFLMCKQIYI